VAKKTFENLDSDTQQNVSNFSFRREALKHNAIKYLEQEHNIRIDDEAYKAYRDKISISDWRNTMLSELASPNRYAMRASRMSKRDGKDISKREAIAQADAEIVGEHNKKSKRVYENDGPIIGAIRIIEWANEAKQILKVSIESGGTLGLKNGIILASLSAMMEAAYLTLNLPLVKINAVSDSQSKRKKIGANNDRAFILNKAKDLLGGDTGSFYIWDTSIKKGQPKIKALARNIAKDEDVNLKEKAISDHLSALHVEGKLTETG